MVFALWHGTMPALLKAFLEQVMRPGVALEYRKFSDHRCRERYARNAAAVGSILPPTPLAPNSAFSRHEPNSRYDQQRIHTSRHSGDCEHLSRLRDRGQPSATEPADRGHLQAQFWKNGCEMAI